MGGFVRKGGPEFRRRPKPCKANLWTVLWRLSAIERFWTGSPCRPHAPVAAPGGGGGSASVGRRDDRCPPSARLQGPRGGPGGQNPMQLFCRLFKFTRFWSLKEAFIKATGEGLSRPLDSFVFSFEPVRIAFHPERDNRPGRDDPADWQFWDWHPANDCVAALAVRSVHASSMRLDAGPGHRSIKTAGSAFGLVGELPIGDWPPTGRSGVRPRRRTKHSARCASVILSAMTAIPFRCATHGRVEMHQLCIRANFGRRQRVNIQNRLRSEERRVG